VTFKDERRDRRLGKSDVPDRRAAVEGERFKINGTLAIVKAKTEGDKGLWVCISCCEELANNMQKDFHCNGKRKRGTKSAPGGKEGSGPEARHVLAWLSFASGNYEVP